jgi:geranylgeranyl diphosphate synthase type II
MNNSSNIFKKYRDKIDTGLADFLAHETERSRYSLNKSKYPHSLYDPLNYIMSGGGKRIRPIILMLACEAFGGNPGDALDAAIAIEILHNFTLVHDDIMDNANTRRGRDTIHKKWDTNAAILVGDELIGLSYRSLLKTKSARIQEVVAVFTDGVIEVCEGQALDKEFETSNDVTLSDYLIMIRKKTAELLRTSALLGAIIGNADESGLGTISSYSENLGLAFQIHDDLLDVIADENEFGKKIGGDILEKKKTYLYLKTIELLGDAAGKEFTQFYNSDLDVDEKILKVIETYRNICALESAKNDIKRYTNKANENLSCFASEKSRNTLSLFSDMLLNRNF